MVQSHFGVEFYLIRLTTAKYASWSSGVKNIVTCLHPYVHMHVLGRTISCFALRSMRIKCLGSHCQVMLFVVFVIGCPLSVIAIKLIILSGV